MTFRVSCCILAVTFLAVVCLATIATWNTTTLVGDHEPGTDAWYTPVEEDFRPTYQADAANKKVQTWEQYWGWVTNFYNGSPFSKGWTHQVNAYLETVGGDAVRRTFRSELNTLGRDICREWAKDNAFRKLDTGDLRRYSAMFEEASLADQRTGQWLRTSIDSIRSDYQRKMRAR